MQDTTLEMITRFFYKYRIISTQAQMLLRTNFQKNDLTLPDKNVLKMLFGMITIILKWCHSPDLNIFQYSCLKIGKSQPCVACKSFACKKVCKGIIGTLKTKSSFRPGIPEVFVL